MSKYSCDKMGLNRTINTHSKKFSNCEEGLAYPDISQDKGLEEAVLDKAVVACAGEDNVVEERDTEDFGSLAKAVRNLAILRAWIETARWLIM